MAAAGISAEHAMSKQLPAPKTFAPSREDVLSNLAFFFGDPGVRALRECCLSRVRVCLDDDDATHRRACLWPVAAVPEKLRDYSEHHAMTFHFPGTRAHGQTSTFTLSHALD